MDSHLLFYIFKSNNSENNYTSIRRSTVFLFYFPQTRRQSALATIRCSDWYLVFIDVYIPSQQALAQSLQTERKLHLTQSLFAYQGVGGQHLVGRVLFVTASTPMGLGGKWHQGMLGGRTRAESLCPLGEGSSMAGYNSGDNTRKCVQGGINWHNVKIWGEKGVK